MLFSYSNILLPIENAFDARTSSSCWTYTYPSLVSSESASGASIKFKFIRAKEEGELGGANAESGRGWRNARRKVDGKDRPGRKVTWAEIKRVGEERDGRRLEEATGTTLGGRSVAAILGSLR